jgi:hypothetical protein
MDHSDETTSSEESGLCSSLPFLDFVNSGWKARQPTERGLRASLLPVHKGTQEGGKCSNLHGAMG